MIAAWALRRTASWNPLDRIIAAYTCVVAALILILWERLPDPSPLLVWHALILALLFALPPRGAAWEALRPGEPLAIQGVRLWFCFLRYTYPLLLALFFFEEAQQTVLVVYPDRPFWFEHVLYTADRRLYGDLPVFALLPYTSPWLDELMHFFYFSYYPIAILGTLFAFFGTAWRPWPAPGFDTVITSVMTSFLLAFVWYPYLPARGPWENAELMAPLYEFRGPVFVPIIKRIISEGAVNGGCFPSGHTAGTWGAVFGLARRYPRLAWLLSFIAAGMSVSCVYTRYHHSTDIAAGFVCAVVGAWIAWKVTDEPAD